MHPDDVSALHDRFGLAGEARFDEGPGGMPEVTVQNALCSGRIAAQGGQLLEWAPAGQEPVVWLSPRARFGQGKSVRGGVPVCWPWFGPHPGNENYPAHGFARTAPWEIIESQRLEDGSDRLGFRLLRTESSLEQWPHACLLEIRHTLGAALEIELWTHNRSPVPIVIGEALHTYFKVSDVRRIAIGGLDGCEYLDKMDANLRKRQAGPLTFAEATDRVYLNTTTDCTIKDPGLNRRIRVQKRGSLSTVVWNPWDEWAARLGDFEPDGYLGMVCVESANTADNLVTVPPGGEHRLWVRYSVEVLERGEQ
jgi:glucose-6-phosphate 1-epimerase